MKTKISTNKALVNNYILSCIDYEGTNAEKLIYVLECFKNEYDCEYNRKVFPNVQRRLSEWLQGLPSAFSVEYHYCDILVLSRAWGYIRENATEVEEDRICANWFNFISSKFFQLCRKEGINWVKLVKM